MKKIKKYLENSKTHLRGKILRLSNFLVSRVCYYSKFEFVKLPLLAIAFFLGCVICSSQSNFLKYSTFYATMNMQSSMIEQQNYVAISKVYEETTQINPHDFQINFGLRKVARMDYEQKLKTWYYGNEESVSDFTTIGNNSSGWEYLFNYSFIRNRGEIFNSQKYWIRYLTNNLASKIEYRNNERVDLKYSSIDLRYRINKNFFDFTFGVVGRLHPVYHIIPIEDFWVSGESSFFDLASDFGYSSQFVNGRFHWFKDGELLATSNDEFFKHYFGDAIRDFNEQELAKLNEVKELSLILGISYYKYRPDFWIHAWFNALPYHYGLDKYSFEYNDSAFEYDGGVVIGYKMGNKKNFGVFIENNIQRVWEKDIFNLQFGFNYLIF